VTPSADAQVASSLHFGGAVFQHAQTVANRVGSKQYDSLPASASVVVFESPADIKVPFEVVANLSHSDPCAYRHCTLKDAEPPLSVKAREVGANAVIVDKYQIVKTSLLSAGVAVEARAVRIKNNP